MRNSGTIQQKKVSGILILDQKNLRHDPQIKYRMTYELTC